MILSRKSEEYRFCEKLQLREEMDDRFINRMTSTISIRTTVRTIYYVPYGERYCFGYGCLRGERYDFQTINF